MTTPIAYFETAIAYFESWVIYFSTSINGFSTSATADGMAKNNPAELIFRCLGGVIFQWGVSLLLLVKPFF